MDAHVAVRAVLISWIGHIVSPRKHRNSTASAPESTGSVVAFETHRKYHRAPQKACISRAVREMAHLTAFDAHRGMFEREGSALVEMALQTRLFVSERLVDQPGARRHPPSRRESAVRIMAIAAGHEPFINAMLKGHRKIRSDVGMAAVTQLGLSFRQQKLGRRGLVNRMALCARNVAEGVRGTANVCAHKIVRMAL
jgi:hypothetical protein